MTNKIKKYCKFQMLYKSITYTVSKLIYIKVVISNILQGGYITTIK